MGRTPPDLPPRNNSSSNPITTTSSLSSVAQSVWAKPLGHVDALFNRKATQTSNNQQIKNEKINSSQQHCEESSLLIPKQTSTATSSSTSTVSSSKESKKESPASSLSSTTSSAVSLMKRLTNIKRSKSPTNLSSFSMDNPVFEGNTPSTSSNVMHSIQVVAHPVHVRSGSCPSQLLQSLPIVDVGCGMSGVSGGSIGVAGGESSGFLFGSKRIKSHGKERPSLHEYVFLIVITNLFLNVIYSFCFFYIFFIFEV